MFKKLCSATSLAVPNGSHQPRALVHCRRLHLCEVSFAAETQLAHASQATASLCYKAMIPEGSPALVSSGTVAARAMSSF